MADNLEITPGVGATVATDDIGGIHYQKVKTVYGADGAAVDATQPLTDTQLRATAVPIIGVAKDAGAGWTSSFGVSGARFTSADQSAAAAAVTDAPTSGQKLVITDVLISVDTAMRVDLKEETSGTVLASLYLPEDGTAQFTPRGTLKLATADKKLMVQTSAAGNCAVLAFYYSEA